MSIVGVGTDLVDLDRFRLAAERTPGITSRSRSTVEIHSAQCASGTDNMIRAPFSSSAAAARSASDLTSSAAAASMTACFCACVAALTRSSTASALRLSSSGPASASINRPAAHALP